MAIGIASLTFILLIFALAFTIAFAQEKVIKAVRVRLQQVKRWGGWILIAVALWFIATSLFADLFAQIFPV